MCTVIEPIAMLFVCLPHTKLMVVSDNYVYIKNSSSEFLETAKHISSKALKSKRHKSY